MTMQTSDILKIDHRFEAILFNELQAPTPLSNGCFLAARTSAYEGTFNDR